MANAETNEGAGQDEPWVASWDAVRQAQLEAALAATAEQRLDWLEEAMRLAQASGALAARRQRPSAATLGGSRKAGLSPGSKSPGGNR